MKDNKHTMKKIKPTKIPTYICLIITALTLIGCADHTLPEQNETAHPAPVTEPENEDSSQKEEKIRQIPAESHADTETETPIEAESESEVAADDFGPVKISQIDYDSFQSRMTDEEWTGFQQYFPVLKENASFELTEFGYSPMHHYTAYGKDGEIMDEEGHPDAAFYRYEPTEMTDLCQYMLPLTEDTIREMMLDNIRIFDLDGDGIQELILQWTPFGDVLVLHCENEKFYGWETVCRGFQLLRTNGIYISSGGALCNSWHQIRFDNGIWIEDTLAEMCQDEYYIGGESVDEDTFWQQIDTYETEEVTGYEPKQHEQNP